jgi:hypothetical protein
VLVHLYEVPFNKRFALSSEESEDHLQLIMADSKIVDGIKSLQVAPAVNGCIDTSRRRWVPYDSLVQMKE